MKNLIKYSTIKNGMRRCLSKKGQKEEGGMMECSRVEIEGIKLALAKFRQTDSQDKRDVLLESIGWLKERYERLGEKEDLERILCHICAYAELGFPYEDVEGLLGQVLEYLNMGKEEKEKFRTIFFPKVPLNKTSINRLLGRWSPTRQSMKIQDAVNDIIQKTADNEEGEYVYHCGKILAQDGEDTLWEHTFRLKIENGEAIFHKVNENEYYRLIKGEKTNDKNSGN